MFETTINCAILVMHYVIKFLRIIFSGVYAIICLYFFDVILFRLTKPFLSAPPKVIIRKDNTPFDKTLQYILQ